MKGVIAPAVVCSSSRSLKSGVTTWDEPGTRGLRDDRMSRGAGNSEGHRRGDLHVYMFRGGGGPTTEREAGRLENIRDRG